MKNWKVTPRVKIKVSQEALDLIRARARGPFHSSLDDQGRITLQGRTFERLAAKAFHGETPSDTIIRLLSTVKGTQ